MALKDILQGVIDELVAMHALIRQDNTQDNTLRIGSSPRSLETAPPAIFWIPKTARGSGPDPAMTRAQQDAFVGNIPRPLHSRWFMVDAHVWAGGPSAADDFSSAELLVGQLVSALHHQAYGQYRYIGEDWISSGSDVGSLGRRVIVHLSISVPLIEYQPAYPVLTESQVVTRSTQTDKMNNTTSETVG